MHINIILQRTGHSYLEFLFPGIDFMLQSTRAGALVSRAISNTLFCLLNCCTSSHFTSRDLTLTVIVTVSRSFASSNSYSLLSVPPPHLPWGVGVELSTSAWSPFCLHWTWLPMDIGLWRSANMDLVTEWITGSSWSLPLLSIHLLGCPVMLRRSHTLWLPLLKLSFANSDRSWTLDFCVSTLWRPSPFLCDHAAQGCVSR